LETDNQPLLYLGKAQYQSGRLMRWALTLQQYQFPVRAIKGSENVGIDFLSRHTVTWIKQFLCDCSSFEVALVCCWQL